MDHLGGFDPSTMTYLASQMAHPNVGVSSADPFQEMLLPMEMPDHHSNYGYGSEDLSMHQLQHPVPPPLKRFPSGYDDPFSDVVSAFDQQIGQEQNDQETHSIDRDNKLLSFSLPTYDYTLLDYSYRRTNLTLSAQLHGMFFLAESPWASAGDSNPPPSELTCYRRNLFQITGEVTIPRTLRYIMTEQGEQIAILGQELVISATESTEGNPVKIISVPWKTPVNPNATTVEDKVEREPPSIPLDLMNVQDLDSDFATFPFQWKRLQFRIATANNGRRKELQQHFVVRLKVVATLATGGKISICDVQSGAIIVRGRSPRNFQSRKDLPLNGSGHIRKSSHLPGNNTRSGSSTDSVAGVKRPLDNGPTSAPIKTEHPNHVPIQSYFEAVDDQPQPDFFDWKAINHPQPTAMTVLPPTSSPAQGAGNVYAISSPEITRKPPTTRPPPAPINLSLVEDDSPHARNGSTPPERAAKKLHLPTRAPSFSLNTINSPDESADLLYEYFPLGLDDWMPPVDAVYRPHVVHHTKLPTDPRDPSKAGAKSAKSKRYFSEDVT